jgi:hypothetical protein
MMLRTSGAGARIESRKQEGRKYRREERFLSAQADAFAGAKAEEEIGLLRSK